MKDTIRVVCWNVKGYQRNRSGIRAYDEQLGKYLIDSKADIIILQEVSVANYGTKIEGQYNKMANDLQPHGYEAYYAHSNFFGMAILVKDYLVKDLKLIKHEPTYAHFTLDIGEELIDVYATHINHGSTYLEKKINGWKNLFSFALDDSISKHKLIIGDLNTSSPTNKVLTSETTIIKALNILDNNVTGVKTQYETSRLGECLEILNNHYIDILPNEATWHDNRLDYAFISSSLIDKIVRDRKLTKYDHSVRYENAEEREEKLSDHSAIYLELKIK